jgi:hypothetical protein
MKRVALTEPLEHTNFPNQDVIRSFAELGRNYIHQTLYNRSLPYNKSVRILYNDGVITSNDICEAMLISCRSFGVVAIIESEIDYVSFQSDDVIKLTYNNILDEKFSHVGLESPIKAAIIKDYESNREMHGIHIEEKIKCFIRNVNYDALLGRGEYFETRNMYPCFFLIN